MIRTAAALNWILGVVFGLPCAYGAWYFAKRGEIWTSFGYPTYGGGPFENIGIKTSVPLLLAFLVICVAEVTMGVLVWRGLRIGGIAR